MSVLPKIAWPIPANHQGKEFGDQEAILAHLAGESTGLYMIGRNGMWHGGIHITHETTPWCALSGKAPSEKIDFPLAYKGEQAVRCMADGDVVAYRICRDYLRLSWFTRTLSFSGSFLLVRHYIQPGETEKSGLRFYTLYMHLAPYCAYKADKKRWAVQDSLSVYHPEWVLTASTNNKHTSDSYREGAIPKGAVIEWDHTNSSLHTTAFNQREYGLVTFKGLSEEARKKGLICTLKPGGQYWMLVDKNNILPADSVAQPSWWRPLLPPAKEIVQFDKVVCPTPYPISAGDPVGHLGYYQAPKDGGYDARYQVHLECFSMDDNVPQFLNNPEQAGAKNPLYLKYSPGIALYKKDVRTGIFARDGRVTNRTGILTLSQIATETDKATKQAFWHIRPEKGYVPKGQKEPEQLSQYDLAKLGFRTKTEHPSGFDYLDGKTQPTGLVRSIFDALHKAAQEDPRITHGLVKYNYQRLLDKIDNDEANYSAMEYWRALHNPDYRDVVQKTIVKHPSDWYCKKEDALWQPFLNGLKKDAPLWKKYSEAFLDMMVWMPEVTTEKLGPFLWHMHPVMFLSCFSLYEYDFSTRSGVIHAIIAECKKQGIKLNTQIAYVLATVKRETGDTFQPVREGNWTGHTVTDEYRRKNFRYYPYYGRGYVQITWDYNYKAYSQKLGIDMVNNPDLALEPEISLFILVDGFKYGVFTGKNIFKYINNTKTDFLNARRCINGLDRAEQIKGFAEVFLTQLNGGEFS